MTTTLPLIGQPLYALGGQIDVRVEVDTGLAGSEAGTWGSGTWGESDWGSVDPAWNDITDYVLGVSTDAGAQRWGERFRPGRFTIRLDNTSGLFTPESGVTTPWALEFRAGRRIRVVAIPDQSTGTKVPLATGIIEETGDELGDGGYDVELEVPCVDYMGLWALHDPDALTTPTGVEDTDERVASALDRFGWPDDTDHRDIQAGAHTMQSSFLAQSTLEECARAADAEGGAFFASPDGKATFKARDWLTTDTRSTVIQGYIGYDSVPTGKQGAHLVDVEVSKATARVRNIIQFARIGGTLQTSSDATSIVLHDRRTYRRTDFHNNADSEVSTLADRHLAIAKDLRLRLESVTIAAVADPDDEDLNRLLWGTQFGDLLKVKVATVGWSFEREVQVFGIHHEITGDDWAVTFRLDDDLNGILT